MCSNRAGLAALLVCFLSLARPARADGPGVLVGESARLHLLFDLESRYDSLAGQGGIGVGNPASAPVDPPEIILHLRPGLKLLAPGNKVDFEANATLDWNRYTGWLATSQQLSFLGANAGATLEMGRGGPVSFRLGESFTRSDRTTNLGLAFAAITNANELGARLSLRPGGGAIEASGGYSFSLESYQSYDGKLGGSHPDPLADTTKLGLFSFQSHRLALDARWRFLPKTAVTLDSSWTFRVYDSTSNIPTKPLRVELGLAGLISEKVRITLRGGWLKTFAASGNDFSSVVGQLEVGWNPTETAGVTVGILRSAEPVSASLGWYDDFRGYLSGRIALGGRLALTGSARVDRIAFGNVGTGEAGPREDTVAALDAALDVELLRLLHAVAGGVITSRGSTEGGFYTYARSEAYLKLQFNY